MSLIKMLLGDVWEVRRCLFPYPEGYGTYNPYRGMILDTGLSKEEAQRRCDELLRNCCFYKGEK